MQVFKCITVCFVYKLLVVVLMLGANTMVVAIVRVLKQSKHLCQYPV